MRAVGARQVVEGQGRRQLLQGKLEQARSSGHVHCSCVQDLVKCSAVCWLSRASGCDSQRHPTATAATSTATATAELETGQLVEIPIRITVGYRYPLVQRHCIVALHTVGLLHGNDLQLQLSLLYVDITATAQPSDFYAGMKVGHKCWRQSRSARKTAYCTSCQRIWVDT